MRLVRLGFAIFALATSNLSCSSGQNVGRPLFPSDSTYRVERSVHNALIPGFGSWASFQVIDNDKRGFEIRFLDVRDTEGDIVAITQAAELDGDTLRLAIGPRWRGRRVVVVIAGPDDAK